MRLNNSTIRVNKKQLKCGHFDFEFSRGRCKQCAIVENMHKQDAKEAAQTEDLQGLVDDADVLVSRFVRLNAMNKEGIVKCFTCKESHPWRQMDAGHYVPRSCMFLRFDLRNIKPQCHTCNRLKYGMSAVFAQNLEKESPGVADWLLEESRVVHHVGREELRQIISEMTEKINKLTHDHHATGNSKG